MTDDIRARNIAQTHAFLDLLSAKNMTAWAELWAEDAVQDMPYSPAGFPKRIEGKAALIRHYANLPTITGRIEFLDRVVLPMLNPAQVALEYRGEIEILTNDRRYDNRYLGLFTFDPDGRIALFREYYDPTILTQAWARDLDDGFSLGKPSSVLGSGLITAHPDPG
jgi:ketosteroid isomerase-like protein